MSDKLKEYEVHYSRVDKLFVKTHDATEAEYRARRQVHLLLGARGKLLRVFEKDLDGVVEPGQAPQTLDELASRRQVSALPKRWPPRSLDDL